MNQAMVSPKFVQHKDCDGKGCEVCDGTGYVERFSRGLTVAQLIEKLQALPQELEVIAMTWDAYNDTLDHYEVKAVEVGENCYGQGPFAVID